MFLIESGTSHAARKTSILMMVVFVLSVFPGTIMTMHFSVRPKPPPPPGFRIFGFPRPRR